MSATRNPVPQDGQRDQSHPSDRLPAWQRVLVVVAHPDDESFGLGAVIDAFVTAGAQVEVLCLTMGEASTLAEGLSPQSVGELPAMRAQELARAADLLGVRRATLVRHPDGALGQQPAGALEADVEAAVDRVAPHGLVVFDTTGVTGHPDHAAASLAAEAVARRRGIPVVGWVLPDAVAASLRQEYGIGMDGVDPAAVSVDLRVSRDRQLQAIAAHRSQAVPGSVLWRRLELLGDHEYLRWIVEPPSGVAPN
jgi:LmbE family N-acetylglucosaminyl deacetylase